jgi:hypothetical protein
MLAEKREDVIDIVAGVNDHRFARGLVADDRAIALQWSNGKDLVNHASIVASCGYQVPSTQ